MSLIMSDVIGVMFSEKTTTKNRSNQEYINYTETETFAKFLPE